VRYGNVLLLLLSLCFSTILWAQEDAPLGDVARRARQARATQPRATLLATNEDFEPTLPRDPEKLVSNACVLLSADDAERILGAPVPDAPHLEADPHGGSACRFAASWGDGLNVEADHTCTKVNRSCAPHDRSPACLVPSQSCGSFHLTIHAVLVSQNGRDTWREHAGHEVAVPVEGLADEADRVPGVKGLNLRAGPYFLTVVVDYEPLNHALPQLIELSRELRVARKIVHRLSGSDADSTAEQGDAAALTDPASGARQDPAERARQQESIRKQRQACIDLAAVVYKEKIEALKDADAPAEAFDQLTKLHQEAVNECQTAPMRNPPQPSQPDM
jgi:hypothetical protein